MIFHALGILAALCDTERENGCPIEYLAILGYPIIHGKPLHPKMAAGLLAIEPMDHDI